MPRLVVGLGNPGKKYEKTRHNVGFLVVDRCCERHGVDPSKKAFEARYAFAHAAAAGGDQAGFVKPQTYMNESGTAVRGFADFYKVEAKDILVVCDDLALPFGQLRIRSGGSSGGQKGLESIIRHLGTQGFPRLRVGIGAPPPFMDAADWVLGQLSEDERSQMQAAVERAADAVRVWLLEGVEKAASKFNAKLDAGEKKEVKDKAEGGDRAPGRDS
jgi:peptidyl-tRNA hydrolase, PTH1 family